MSVLIILIATAVLIHASDWISDSSYEYIILNETKTFEQCNKSCTNSTMIIIYSKDIEKILNTTIYSQNVTEIYLGMTRSENATFLWLNGAIVKDNYTNWCMNEPKNQTSCGVWFAKKSCWRGDNCNVSRSCCCQILSALLTDGQGNKSTTLLTTNVQPTTMADLTTTASSMIYSATTSSITSAAETTDSLILKTTRSEETTFLTTLNSFVTSSPSLVTTSQTSTLFFSMTSTSTPSSNTESATSSPSLSMTAMSEETPSICREAALAFTNIISIILGILSLVSIAVIVNLAVKLKKARKELKNLKSEEDGAKNMAKEQSQAIQNDRSVACDISTELRTSTDAYLVLEMNPEEPQMSISIASNSEDHKDFENATVSEVHDYDNVAPDPDSAAEHSETNNYVNVVQKPEQKKEMGRNYENIAPDEYIVPDEEPTNHNYVNIVVKSEENVYERTNTK